ncbi:rhomboid family intramembrane serine protease [Mucilaginibacter limnophilus]|uniref:Rhomboid family intramembrane serine protease n=1 Tax=Mucilaginibacter limnophilus TaxID=1932778 RepID=A0A437MQ12_9SPHI|nr:rhomboid family intramembrane serine protease [Mucilaginibacter limnophilus]RVT99733.1 rhomboid family intramembrane serine protease [Mucilaginibacter limnophilus]
MTPAFSEQFSQSPLTFILLFIIALTSAIGMWRRPLLHQLLLAPYSIIHKKEYYRLFTADAVHNSWPHVAVNLGMLYIFGAPLEQSLRFAGHMLIFVLVYFSGLLAGGVAVAFHHRNDRGYLSAGCSGSVMACMFSSMLMLPDRIVFYVPGIGAVSNIYSGLFYLVILWWVGKKDISSRMNHEQHFYGALGGITVTVGLFPEVLKGLS